MIPFNRATWYVKADDGRIFSCATCALVPESDEAYEAFLAAAAPGGPVPWPKDANGGQTDAALDAWLMPAGLSTTGRIRLVSGYALLAAMTDSEASKLKTRDVARLSGRGGDNIPETSAFVARVAGVAGTTPAAWFDAASA